MLKSIDERGARQQGWGLATPTKLEWLGAKACLWLSNAFWHSSKVTERETSQKMMEKSGIYGQLIWPRILWYTYCILGKEEKVTLLVAYQWLSFVFPSYSSIFSAAQHSVEKIIQLIFWIFRHFFTRAFSFVKKVNRQRLKKSFHLSGLRQFWSNFSALCLVSSTCVHSASSPYPNRGYSLTWAAEERKWDFGVLCCPRRRRCLGCEEHA